MAKYRTSQDLGALIGVRYVNIPNEQGQPIPGIFIPTGINGIDVKADNRDENHRNASGINAWLNCRLDYPGNAFLQACRQRLMRENEVETPYNIPAFNVNVATSEEKRNKIREAIAKRMRMEHPEWKDLPDEKGNELAKAISRLMPYTIGQAYLVEPKNAPAQQQPFAPVTQNVSGYTPAPVPQESNYEDGLPF